MCEHSSVNPAVALREARRRKILENSANRLKLIEGVNSSFAKASTESFPPEPKPELQKNETLATPKESSDSEIKSKLSDVIASNRELKEISDFLLRDHSKTNEDEDAEEEEEEELLVKDVGKVEEKKGNLYVDLLLQKRLHYILLALTVNILFFFEVGYLFYENIFCPFYTVKAIELVSRGRQKEDFQPMLFLFIAGLPKSIQKFTKVFLTLSITLLSDLCLYLFVFLIGTKILNIEGQ